LRQPGGALATAAAPIDPASRVRGSATIGAGGDFSPTPNPATPRHACVPPPSPLRALKSYLGFKVFRPGICQPLFSGLQRNKPGGVIPAPISPGAADFSPWRVLGRCASFGTKHAAAGRPARTDKSPQLRVSWGNTHFEPKSP
jgi:hypothetical protein